MIISPAPDWELAKADFDTEYTEMKKEGNPHIISQIAKSHLADNYSNQLKTFTYGAVLEDEQAGGTFVTPEFTSEKGFHFGKGRCILTAQLVALLMALSYIVHLPMALFNIVLCGLKNSVIFTEFHR